MTSQGFSATQGPKLGPATYHSNVDDNTDQPKSEIRSKTSFNQVTNLNSQPHYKLKQKKESYSKKGFGNGFASKTDRFTGVHEAKFQIIAWFKNNKVCRYYRNKSGNAVYCFITPHASSPCFVRAAASRRSF